MFLKAGSAMTASGKPVPQMTLTRSDGDRHQFAIADRGAYTGVTAKWLHTKDPKPAKAESNAETQAKREAPARTGTPKSKAGQQKDKGQKRTGST